MNAHIGWTPGLRLNLLRSKSNAPQSANPGGVNESGRFMAKRTPEPRDGKALAPVEAFRTSADHLIRRETPWPELNEAQRLSLQLVEQLAILWDRRDTSIGAEALQWLREVDGLGSGEQLEVRRWRCVQLIHSWGAKWKTPEWQASDETRHRLLSQLAYGLSYETRPVWTEPSPLDVLNDDPQQLEAWLNAYEPEPKGMGRTGRMSAERILAEVIVQHCDSDGALGLKVDASKDDASAAEAIRSALAKAVSKVTARQNPA